MGTEGITSQDIITGSATNTNTEQHKYICFVTEPGEHKGIHRHETIAGSAHEAANLAVEKCSVSGVALTACEVFVHSGRLFVHRLVEDTGDET